MARIEGVDPDAAERLARHAAIAVLLRTRLSAALYVAEQQHTRSERELPASLLAQNRRLEARAEEVTRRCLTTPWDYQLLNCLGTGGNSHPPSNIDWESRVARL